MAKLLAGKLNRRCLGEPQQRGHELHIGMASRQWTVGNLVFGWWWTRDYGKRVHEHQHEQAHIMFACTGEYRSRVEGVNRAEHRIIFNPAMTVHEDRFETPGLFFTINFNRSPEAILDSEVPSLPTLAKSLRARCLLNQLMGMTRHGREEPTATEFILAELMAEFGGDRMKERQPPWLQRVVEVLHDQSSVPNIGELTNAAGVHPYHLAAVFRRAYGCTPAHYARNIRTSRALSALVSTRVPIAEIAVEHGFSDQSHFTRAVSAMCGVSPAKLRHNLN